MYPEHILRKLRQREDLERHDTSNDEAFNQLSKATVFNEVCMWEGLVGYGDTITGWIQDIYGVDLNN